MAEIRRATLFGKLNAIAYKGIESATVFCKMRGNPNVETAHWLHQLLQSQETDVTKRKKLVWEIDKKLQEDVARPIIFHSRTGSCWQPYVKGITIMVNSSYNGYRYEDMWMDK